MTSDYGFDQSQGRRRCMPAGVWARRRKLLLSSRSNAAQSSRRSATHHTHTERTEPIRGYLYLWCCPSVLAVPRVDAECLAALDSTDAVPVTNEPPQPVRESAYQSAGHEFPGPDGGFNRLAGRNHKHRHCPQPVHSSTPDPRDLGPHHHSPHEGGPQERVARTMSWHRLPR